MKELPLTSVTEIIGSGPIVMVATTDGQKNDVMTMAWHTMVDFNPPLVAIVMGSDHLSYDNLVKTRECVIAVPGADLIETALAVGSCTGRNVDKFKKYDIAAENAALVKAPLLTKCLYNFECRIKDDSLAANYGLFILEVVKARGNPAPGKEKPFNYKGNGVFILQGEVRDYSARSPE